MMMIKQPIFKDDQKDSIDTLTILNIKGGERARKGGVWGMGKGGKGEWVLLLFCFNPSHAKATFVQRKRMQIFIFG